MALSNKFNIKKSILYAILPLIMAFAIWGIMAGNSAHAAYAASDNPYGDGDRRIYDEAGLLTDTEEEELEALSREYGEKAGIEIFVLTHNDENSTYPEKYIEDFEDRLPVADRVYFLYDVYRGEIFMEGYGLAETYIHSKRIDKIFDMVVDDLRSGNYFVAFKKYIIRSAAYMEDDSELNYDHNYKYDSPPENFDPDNKYSYDDYDYDKYYKEEEYRDNIFFNIGFQFIISLIIGAVVVGAMAYNSGGRMTAGARNYLDQGRSGLFARTDQYTHSTITKTRKPSSNTTGGGSGRGGFNSSGFRGGVSSGGRSHSSGGRKL